MHNFPEVLPADSDPASARYFPPASGQYEVKPGLFRLGQDLGNGPADARVFQFDGNFPLFRQTKLMARAERLEKYYQTCDYPQAVAGAVARFIAHRLAEEYSESFRLEEGKEKTHLRCALTGETLAFDAEFQLVGHCRDFADPTVRRGNSPGGVFQGRGGGESQRGGPRGLAQRQGEGYSAAAGGQTRSLRSAGTALQSGAAALAGKTTGAGCAPTPPYASALDALACQVQEDLAVVCRAPDGKDWLAAVHLCSPNHWAAEEKVGRAFAIVHAPVAGMAPLNQRSGDLVRAMIERGQYVRFAWGLGTDTRLNHHPEPPPGIPPKKWQGRSFDPAQPSLFVRLERQVLWGFPQENASLFLIRTYFRDCAALTPPERRQLRAALASMTPETLAYKGLTAHRDAILEWLSI